METEVKIIMRLLILIDKFVERWRFCVVWQRQLAFFAAAFVSVLYQGFRYRYNNNSVHVPILQVSGQPSLYTGDPFIATFSNYPGGLWRLLAAMHLQIDWAPVFLALHIFSRYMMIVAFYAVLSPYVQHVGRRAVGAMLLANAAVLFGYSAVSGHTLFVNYFEHTQVANAVLLFACAAWLQRREIVASILLGITFDVNAFVGAWGVAALLLASLIRGDWRLAQGFRPARIMGVFLVSAAPALFLIGLAITRNAAAHVPSFDYRIFLHQGFPEPVFINVANISQLTRLSVIVLTCSFAIAALGRADRVWRSWGAPLPLSSSGVALPLLLLPVRCCSTYNCFVSRVLYSSSRPSQSSLHA